MGKCNVVIAVTVNKSFKPLIVNAPPGAQDGVHGPSERVWETH